MPAVGDEAAGVVVVEHLRIVARCGCVFGNVLRDDTSGTNGRVASNRHVFDNAYARTDVDIVAYGCRMAAVGAYRCELGQVHVVADYCCAVDDDGTVMADVEAVSDLALERQVDSALRSEQPKESTDYPPPSPADLF